MRIVGFRAANTASTQFRVVNWIDALGRLGHDATSYGSPFHAPTDTTIVRSFVEEFDARVNGADVVLYGLTVEAREIAMLQAGRAAHGYRLVVDTDDLVTEVPSYNQASSWYHNASGLIRIAESQYRNSDALVVSTEELRRMSDHYNPRVIHMPNVVDPGMYEPLRFREKEPRHKDDIRIFWGGGGGHWDDLLIVKDALLKVCAARPNVKLVFGNFVPGWAMSLPSNRVFLIPMQPFSNYYKVLAWACPDIGLAPLVDNQFNRCKSHVKYLDYTLTATPGVYSALEPYGAITDGETGLIARTESDWYDRIMELVDNAPLRRKIALNSWDDVMGRWHVDKWIGRYEQMLNEVISAQPPAVHELAEGVPIACQTPL